MKVTKLFNTSPSSLNDDDMSVRFTISNNKVDRQNEIVDQSWDLSDYKANPIVLWGHDPEQPENVLGTAQDITVSSDRSHTDATLKFSKSNPRAQMVYNLIKEGVLKTVSIGFNRGETDYSDDGTPILKNNKVFEVSVVPVPANPSAVALAYKARGISQKDAKWLVESMKHETEVIEKQLTDDDVKEKSMTEDQAKEVLEAVSKLTEQVSELSTKVDGVQTASDEKLTSLTEQLTALNPVETDDSAKDGDNDQSGADDDDLDLNAELTPEQEKEAREALGLPDANETNEE